MRHFLSICSGIEAASVAFQPLGWEAVAFAEIEPFPSAVLAHHYPQVQNLGDMTRFREWDADLLARADMLCGGTPCQAFSVAGLRGSLDDERGNLTLTFCHLYDHLDDLRARAGRAPAVCLWENVPGVLSTADNAFGSFLAGLAGESVPLQPPGGKWSHAGYVRGPRRAVAWRILDAQYHGLAQRRQRVFVVASADPAFDPAAVLFEFDGVRRDSPPRREAGEGTAHDFAPSLTSSGRGIERPGESRGQDPVVADWETRRQGEGERMTKETLAFGGNNTAGAIPAIPALNANRGCHNPGDFEAGALLVEPVAGTLMCGGKTAGSATTQDAENGVTEITHALRGEGFDASEDGTGRGTPIVPIAFSCKDHGADASVDLAPTLRAGNHSASHANGGNPPAIAFPERLSSTACVKAEEVCPALGALNPTAVAFQPRIARNGRGDMGDLVNALNAHSGTTGKGDAAPCVAYAFHENQRAEVSVNDTVGALNKGGGKPGQGYPAVAFQERGRKDGRSLESQENLAYSLNAPNGGGRRQELNVVDSAWRVRRLTPEECELLQGFPSGYTLIPGKHRLRKGDDLSDSIDYLIALGFQPKDIGALVHCPDGPRYKALGNSWAVPCVRWIGARITAALDLLSNHANP